jgi:predicted DNA-binding transcriptional regulator YafY
VSTSAKLQRWMDLIATLLAHRYGVTLAELRESVPGYAGGSTESSRRTFERDKDELRRLGVPITTRGTVGAEDSRYIIASDRFYLPYLAVVTPRGRIAPKAVDKYGYHSVGKLDLSDIEVALLADAAARVRQLGDPVLAADAGHALAKLAVDIPADTLSPTPNVALVPPRRVAAGSVFEQLTDALLRRKSVTFTYYGIERDETERRVVLAYGLAFTSGHWYLHAMDPSRGAVRRFRVARMRDVAVNPRTPNTEDFAIPAHFSLADRARPVPAWELGDDAAIDVTVRFAASNGWVRSARAHGDAVRDDKSLTRYTVRRVDAFCRWLLALAGDAEPVSPPDVVRAWKELAKRTMAAADPVT